MNINLEDKVMEGITSNFLDKDPFYEHSSRFIVEGIIEYLSFIYNEDVTEEIVVQELINLFPYLDRKKIPYSLFWTKINKQTKYHHVAIDVLSEGILNNVFSYVLSAIISSLAYGIILEDKNFKARIPQSVILKKEDE